MFGSSKILPPSAGLDVGGVGDALPLVRVGDDLEEQATSLLVEGDVAELVNDQEPGPADLGEFPSSLLSVLALSRRMTSSAAVKNLAGTPSRVAREASRTRGTCSECQILS